MRNFFKYVGVVALLLGASVWYYVKQPQVTVADGKGWDGVTYHQMYQHFNDGVAQPVYAAPFNKRVGLPWLAAHLPLEETQAFRTINIGCGLIACLLIYLALIRRFAHGIAFACLLPAVFYVFSPVRFPNFYPYTVDPPAFMLYALAAFMVSRRSYLLAGVALTSSIFFRESGAYLAMALGAALWISERERRPVAWAIFTMAASGALVLLAIQLPGGKYSQLYTVLSFFKHKLLEPLEFLRAVACLSMTLAPFLICRARRRPDSASRHDAESRLGQVFMFLSIAMAVFGGSDTTRILFIGYPLYVALLACWLSESDSLSVVLASAAGLIANSFREMIPQPSAPMPDRDVAGLFAFTPDYAHPGVIAAFMAYWAFWWFVLVGPGRLMVDEFAHFLARSGGESSR